MVSAVLLLALLLRLWHLSDLTDNYDEGVYWSSLRAMYAGNSLFTPVFSSQPPFFLLSLYPLVALFGPSLLVARLEVVIFSLLGILAMYLLARRLGGPWAGMGAALLLAGDYLAVIQAQTIEAEAPSVALMIVAVAAATYSHRYPWQMAALSGAATALALLEKLFAVAALVPILALFIGSLISFERSLPTAQQPPGRLLGRWPLPQRQTLLRAAKLLGTYAAGLALTGLLVFLPYLGQLQSVYQQVIAFHLAADNAYASTLSQNPATLVSAVTEYPLALLALIGLVVGLLRRRWQILTAAAWVVAALVILLRQAPLFAHHLVLLVPALALCAAVGLAPNAANAAAQTAKQSMPLPLQRLFSRWGTGPNKLLRPGLPIVLLALMLAFNLSYTAVYPLGKPAPELNPPLVNAARITQITSDLQRLTTPQQQIITDDQYLAALADRTVPPELVDTSNVRISTGYLTTAQVIAIAQQPQVGAVLFYTGRLDQLPGWRAWVEQHFRLARAYGPGQALYLRVGP